jgi:hypothetical protein
MARQAAREASSPCEPERGQWVGQRCVLVRCTAVIAVSHLYTYRSMTAVRPRNATPCQRRSRLYGQLPAKIAHPGQPPLTRSAVTKPTDRTGRHPTVVLARDAGAHARPDRGPRSRHRPSLPHPADPRARGPRLPGCRRHLPHPVLPPQRTTRALPAVQPRPRTTPSPANVPSLNSRRGGYCAGPAVPPAASARQSKPSTPC